MLHTRQHRKRRSENFRVPEPVALRLLLRPTWGILMPIVFWSAANPYWWGWHRFLIWERRRRGLDC